MYEKVEHIVAYIASGVTQKMHADRNGKNNGTETYHSSVCGDVCV